MTTTAVPLVRRAVKTVERWLDARFGPDGYDWDRVSAIVLRAVRPTCVHVTADVYAEGDVFDFSALVTRSGVGNIDLISKTQALDEAFDL